MIEAIIFDIDDTLIDHSKAVKKAIGEFYDKYIKGSNIDKKEFRNIWQEEQKKYMENYLNNAVTFEEQRCLRIQSVFKKIGVYIDVDTSYEYFIDYLKMYEKHWVLFDDVMEVLNNFKNKKLGIISDGGSHKQRDKLKEFRIEKYFDTIVISDDISATKPSKEIFIKCINRLQIIPESALYVGDDYKRDFKGAIKNGLKACLIDRYSDIKIEKIDKNYKINSLKNLRRVIKKLN